MCAVWSLTRVDRRVRRDARRPRSNSRVTSHVIIIIGAPRAMPSKCSVPVRSLHGPDRGIGSRGRRALVGLVFHCSAFAAPRRRARQTCKNLPQPLKAECPQGNNQVNGALRVAQRSASAAHPKPPARDTVRPRSLLRHSLVTHRDGQPKHLAHAILRHRSRRVATAAARAGSAFKDSLFKVLSTLSPAFTSSARRRSGTAGTGIGAGGGTPFISARRAIA